MASLPLCSTTAGGGISSHSHLSQRPLFLATPPQMISTRSPWSRRSMVSCNAENGEKTNSTGNRVDRRNLLVGMGGLYGATNLIIPSAPSLANPIASPDLSKCTIGKNLNIKEQPDLDVNCCPPTSEKIIDYKLPSFTTPRVRPAAHLVTEEYIEKYERATRLMKELPADDPCNFMQQANVHCAYCNLTYEQNLTEKKAGDPAPEKLQIHFSWLFFPWHRWYLYFYERILAKQINDPTFALPYWNWDDPDGMYMPAMYDVAGSSLYNSKRNQKHIPSADPKQVVDLLYSNTKQTDADIVISSNLTEMYSEMIRNAKTPEDFYGAKYVEGSEPGPGAGSVERGSHTALHMWVGDPRSRSREDMGNFYSTGRDPLFFCHHANVDRMWSIWRELRGKNKPNDFEEDDWRKANFLFYDENSQLVRVKVEDCLDELSMGFTYEKQPLPWLGKRPKSKVSDERIAAAHKAKVKSVTTFPVKLDAVVRVLVDRPKINRTKEEKDEKEEMLVVEGISVDSSKSVRFDVFVNDDDHVPGVIVDKAEYAGCYAQVPHSNSSKVTSKIRLGLNELLEDLNVEGDEQILVSLVPRDGGEDITIGGLKIIYVKV